MTTPLETTPPETNVTSLHNAQIKSERRAEFLKDVASVFDGYATSMLALAHVTLLRQILVGPAGSLS